MPPTRISTAVLELYSLMSLHPNDCSTRFYQSEKEENKRSRCAVAVSKKSSKSRGWKEVTCGHNAQERALCGTWYTPELQKAVEKGYQILNFNRIANVCFSYILLNIKTLSLRKSMFYSIKKALQFEFSLCLHNFLHHVFCHGFLTR